MPVVGGTVGVGGNQRGCGSGREPAWGVGVVSEAKVLGVMLRAAAGDGSYFY